MCIRDSCEYVEPVCVCQSKCTEELYNSECPVCASAPVKCSYVEQPQADLVVTGWKWIFEEEVLEADILNELPLDASQEVPAYFDDVLELLPCEISATLEGQTDPTPLPLTWVCPDYPETGAYEGEYTFTAALPAGFSLAEGTEAPSVLVKFGGVSTWEGEGEGDVATVTVGYSGLGGGTTSRPFSTIESAFQYANGRDSSVYVTLTLLNTCYPTGDLTVTGNFTLDCNGHEMHLDHGSLIIQDGGKLRIIDTDQTDTSNYSIRGKSQTKVIVQRGGHLNVDSGAKFYNNVQNGCCVTIGNL